MGNFLQIIIFIFPGLTISGCKKDSNTNPAPAEGRVSFLIDHKIDGSPVEENKMICTNAAGNQYLVAGLKYFISDITFYKQDGTKIFIHQWKDIFYVDEDISSTKNIFFFLIPYPPETMIQKDLSSVSRQKKQIIHVVNPPEVNMFWPEVLDGGGYHYMMLDGKWKDTVGML